MTDLRKALAIASLPVLLAAATTASDPVKALSGRYDREFPNGLITGEKYIGQHIIEIVPVAPRAAYVRVHLDYFNGHSCAIWGIAGAEGDALVYHDPEPNYEGRKCALSISRAGKSLVIDDDDGTCSAACGARGTLSEVKLPYSSKRPISYLARLRASAEYKTAIAQWRSGHSHP